MTWDISRPSAQSIGHILLSIFMILVGVNTHQIASSSSGTPTLENILFQTVSDVLGSLVAVTEILSDLIIPITLLTTAVYLIRAYTSPFDVQTFGIEGQALDPEAVDLGDHDDAECLTCGRDVGPGVRRGYAEEIVVGGVPIWETDRSETFDCAAHTDRAGLDALNEDDEERDSLDIALDATETEQDGDGR